MYEFSIPDMSCGHCVKAVDEAIRTADAAAKPEIDLAAKTARVDSTLDPAQIGAALEEAGYPASYTRI